jgi:hypothetical protein
MIHIRPYRDDLTTTLCGIDLATAGYILHEGEADDGPMPGPTGVDLRCPVCWEVWRIRWRIEHGEGGPA